jgi:ketosteroid isomerase-like protein
MKAGTRLEQTNRFLDLLERSDHTGMVEMLDDEVVWSTPMSSSDNAEDDDPVRGREAFESHLGSIGALMKSAKFTDRRITVSADEDERRPSSRITSVDEGG